MTFQGDAARQPEVASCIRTEAVKTDLPVVGVLGKETIRHGSFSELLGFALRVKERLAPSNNKRQKG